METDKNLVVENDIKKGAVHMHPPVVLNKAKFTELIQKETDAGTRSTDHLG
jgi:hypothetical protein